MQDIVSVIERLKRESGLNPRSAQQIQGHLAESTIARYQAPMKIE